MKKIISMLLVLTIVVTTLVGVMVVDVNAMEVTGGEGNDSNTRTWNINMSIAKKQRTAMATGYWTVTPSMPAKGEPTSYNLGQITQVSNLGKIYWHLDFKAIDYKDADNKNATTAAYARFRTESTNPGLNKPIPDKPDPDDLIPKILIADFNKIVGGTTDGGVTTYGDMIRYTFYAYTHDKDTADFSIQFAHPDSGIGSVSIPASLLYSENMIPHKVDVYVWSNSVDKTVGGSGKEGPNTEAVYFNVFVDGIQSVATSFAAETTANLYNAKAFQPQFFLNFNPVTSTKNGKVFNFKGSDWYISHDGNKSYEQVTRANLDDDYFAEIKVKDTYTKKMADGVEFNVTNKKDNIKGVKADVDAALEAAVVKEAGRDRKAEIYNEYYTNPASIFTGEETNVKLVDRTTGAVVAPAEATGTMDNYLFMVNGVYIVTTAIPDPPKYETAPGKSFEAEGHNIISYRAKHEDYVNNPYTDEKAFGGLTSGFYRFTHDPRSSVFDKGSLQYNKNNGYVSMHLYNNGITLGSADAELSKYTVRKNIATTEFDIYLPEYTPAGSENFRIAMGFYNNGWNTSNRYIGPEIYFTTGGIKGNMTTKSYLPYTVDVTPNTWNTISIQFDMEAAKVDGMINCNVYVNGKLSKSFDIGDAAKGVKFDDEAIKYYAPIAFMRMYSPKYTQYGATPGAWYIGDYTPKATPVSTGKLTSADSKITVAEDDLLISSKYATEAETIAALPGYIPVYASSIDINTVDAKYDKVDGNIEKNDVKEGTVTVGYKYTGIIIKRLCDLAGWFDITEDKATGKNIYTLPSSNPTKGIVSAVDNGDNTATLTVTTEFGFSNTVEGACHDVSSLIAEYPELKKDSLIGFALVEEGKLPKVYTLTKSGLNLRDLTFNKDTNKAELYIRKLGTVEGNGITFQLVVAAYDKDGKLLELKSDKPQTINNSTPDGERTITFKPEFSAATLDETHHYKVFMFDSLVKCIPLFKSAKITK